MAIITDWISRGPRVAESVASLQDSRGTTSARAGIQSPWTTGQLQQLVWSDIFGLETQWITRAEALTIPAVFKARAVLLSLIADKVLYALRNGVRVEPQPVWLSWTPGQLSPWQRMANTVDDLVFYGWSLWSRENGSRGEILSATRIPFEFWTFDANGNILVRADDGEFKPVDPATIILIPGPSAGLLEYATRTLRGAARLETSWANRAASPIPAIDLHETVMSGITETEAQDVVNQWAAARQDPNGATAFTPYNIEARALGNVSPDLFIEGRNATRIDVANFFNLPAQLLDGSLSTASLTYSTQEGRRNDVLDYGLPYWIRPIESRLSQDDVVPRGQSVGFDFGPLASTTTPTTINVPD
jgi:hypothetical protein